MALYGMIAGIHGNREALAAVLAALAARRAERVVCLGDIVGYNADPDECVQTVRRRCAAVIAGPRDLIAIGRRGFDGCSNEAEYALRRTRRELSGESRAWLAGLPSGAALQERVTLVPGEVQVIGTDPAPKVHQINSSIAQEASADGKLLLRTQDSYLIDPGPVDASRKRSHKLAECAIFNSAAWSVEFLHVAYDGAASEAKAAVFGYRITPLTDSLYGLKRRFVARP